jgi:hypothetical protein
MARIRSLLATEAFADPDAAVVSEADVRRALGVSGKHVIKCSLNCPV